MSNQDRSQQPDPAAQQPAEAAEPAEPAEQPLNRAERRAQQRGRKPATPPVGKGPQAHHEQVMVPPRRSGRRGNR
jgi:hypothetical protein